MSSNDNKPTGAKNYGHIAHLPGSRLGTGDHKCHEGQSNIATLKTRDKYDEVVVQEKLDGSNVGVALINNTLHPLTRAGYLASTSKYEQHWRFSNWVYQNSERFFGILKEGERVVGEWLMQAHGTRYELKHEPFVIFDIMVNTTRLLYDDVIRRVANYEFITPYLLHRGNAFSIDNAIKALGDYGHHGAIDKVEGAVWRVERKGEVDFLVKYVRQDKEDGLYLQEKNGKTPVWNWVP